MTGFDYDPFDAMKVKSRPTIQQIKLKDGVDAKELIWQGLTTYEGNNAKWLPEYDEVVDWLNDNKHKGLMLQGNCGLGKTMIAMHILPTIFKHFCENGDGFSTDRICDIEVYSANQMNEVYRKEETRSHLFYNHPIMIDDVGTEPEIITFGEKHMVFSEIVDHCEKNGRLLIITTNLTSEQIQVQYDTRIRDRLRYLVRKIGFEGKSMRK
jgi:DNA replication protein DnaC